MRWLWLPLLALVLVFTVVLWHDGDQILAGIYLVGGFALTWWVCPWRCGRTTTRQDILTMSDEQRPVVIYWRPGCPYCARLKASLGKQRRRAQWVNIWQDDEAAAFVRSVNDGNETVPTVVIDDVPHTNPAPKTVAERLRAT